MPDNPLSSGWNNVEDAVPVRVTESAAPVQQEKPAAAAQPAVAPIAAPMHQKRPEASVQPNPGAMRFSAVAGIAVVLITGTLYLGIDNLRGSLTDSATSGTTITITEQKEFSPATVSVTAGSTLTLENKNKDPQVIKVKSGSELFPTQVLFDKPYTFTIPSEVVGTFTYFSETMPTDQVLEITVTPSVEASASASSAPSIPIPEQQTPLPQGTDIPLPFGGPVDAPPASSASSSAMPETTISVQPTEASSSSEPSAPADNANGTEILSVGAAADANSSPTSFDAGAIPVNPYTVATAKNRGNPGATIAGAAKKLHSGAPLLEMRTLRPRSNASTGNEFWLALVPAMLGMFLMYRKIFAI